MEDKTAWFIPHIGKQCFVNWNEREESREVITPKFFGDKSFVFEDKYGNERCAYLDSVLDFSSLETEAEKMRNKRLEDLAEVFWGDKALVDISFKDHRGLNAIIDAGYIKTKPINDDVIDKLWSELMGADVKGFAYKINAFIRGESC